MPTTLILLRHGATAANLIRPYTLQGMHEDSELTEVGQLQAQAAARFLLSYPITKVYCSPLKRARRSGEIIAEALGIPWEIADGIEEVDVGAWGGLTWEEVQRRWPEAATAFHDDPETDGYRDGENLAQVRDRLLPVIHKIISNHQGQTFMVVGHGVVNRVLLAHWLGLPLRYARRLPQDNTGINMIDFLDGIARVRTVNSAIHLAATPLS